MPWFAAPRPCCIAHKLRFAVFRKKRIQLAPVCSTHAFVPPIFGLFLRKCFVLLRPSPAFLHPSPASLTFARKVSAQALLYLREALLRDAQALPFLRLAKVLLCYAQVMLFLAQVLLC